MTTGDNVQANNNQVLPADATLDINTRTQLSGKITLPIKLGTGGGGGAGNLASATGSYTGLGDGTPNPITFPGLPVLFVVGANPASGSEDGQYYGSGSTILAMEGGSHPITQTSALFNSATVDIDALNTLFIGSLANDINKVSTTYDYFVVYVASGTGGGSISNITSSTLTVTNPTGPTTNIEAPAAAPAKAIIGFGTGTGTVAAGSDKFYGIVGVATSEGDVQFIVPYNCTMKNLGANIGTNSNASGTGTVTLRKNAADTALTFTVAAGVTGPATDLTHTATFAAFDLCTVHVDMGGMVGGSFAANITVEINPT